MEGTPGAPLSLNTIANNLRSALGQIRAETQPGDAGGMVRLDGRAAAPTALDVADVVTAVERKLRDAIRPNASGTPEGVNVQFIEILYRDASGTESRLVLEVRYATTTSDAGPRVTVTATPLGSPPAPPSSPSGPPSP
jgi:hypothetical protein